MALEVSNLYPIRGYTPRLCDYYHVVYKLSLMGVRSLIPILICRTTASYNNMQVIITI